MGFLERAIRRGISEGLGKAVGNAINQAIEPKAAEFANKTAARLDEAAGNSPYHGDVTNTSGAFSDLECAAMNFATKQAENLKICSNCGEAASSSQKFCQNCGNALPEITVAGASVCTSCGKQNAIGTKFCTDCGAKLPAALMEEESSKAKMEALLAQWQVKLSNYPLWQFGGSNPYLDEYDGYTVFGAEFKGNYRKARNAMEQYRSLAKQNGFRQAGQYPSEEHLYKMVDGACLHIDFEHCFESDSDCISLAFNEGEPTGGFDYIKPEPKKPVGMKDIFNF